MSRMRVVVLSFIVMVLCCSLFSGFPTDTSTDPAATTVRVFSYNVENAFDDRVDGTEYSDYGPSSNYYTDRLWQVKIDHIREVLEAAGRPHVVGLVEVENDRTASMVLEATHGLYDPWFEMLVSLRGSAIHGSTRQSLDHIIMSPGLFDGTRLSYDVGSFDAFRAPFLLSYQRAVDGRPVPNRWQESGNRHGSNGYSDHLPVIADFTVNPG